MATTTDSSTAAAPAAAASDSTAAAAASAPSVSSTTKSVVPDAVPVDAAPAPIEVTLEEFCADASRDRTCSVELLAGFHHSEVAKGRLKQTAEAFQADLTAFCGAEPARPNRPTRIAPAAMAAVAARSSARR